MDRGLQPNQERKSPPVRGRGLKLVLGQTFNETIPSPPVRGRGLKPGVARGRLRGR